MKWIELQVKTCPQNEDIISNILYNKGATGLSIEDPKDVLELSQLGNNWDFIDQDLIKKDSLEKREIIIKAYFAEKDGLKEEIESIKENIEKGTIYSKDKSLGKVFISTVDEDDWAESWKQYYKPRKIGEKIVIKPSWEEYEGKEEDIIIELDPGMAFGTGTHETTILCIEALEKYVKPQDRVYDIGCGSGILSIVAAKLGAKDVIGIDLDELCVKVSKENIILNKVDHIVKIKKGDLLAVLEERADLIVSNIIAEIIVDMTEDLNKFLIKDGIFIASGIIVEKIDIVEEALKNKGFDILEINKLNGWASIIGRKK